MDWKLVWEIVSGVLFVVGGFLVSYFKTSAVFRGFVAKLIADAEQKYAEKTKAGAEKMAWVVSKLYGYIPIVLQPFFSEKQLTAFVQTVFDSIQQYATVQLDKLVLALEAKYDEQLSAALAGKINAEAELSRNGINFQGDSDDAKAKS